MGNIIQNNNNQLLDVNTAQTASFGAFATLENFSEKFYQNR